jgi:hypothetical protein
MGYSFLGDVWQMIKKEDLIISDKMSFCYSDYPYVYRNGGHDLSNKAYKICIGRYQISGIIECNNGKWVVRNVFSSFKSFDAALKGLLKRLNYNDK